MTLRSYLARLENTLRSRQDYTIEQIWSDTFSTGALFRARLRFYDNSNLYVAEDLESLGRREIERVEYAFHYQTSDGALIFRYDNSPHYPNLPTFPAHKHTPNGVVAADAPDRCSARDRRDSLSVKIRAIRVNPCPSVPIPALPLQIR
ncbi:MAG: hypothetical protein DWI57_09850 [Chloroflexi bacterium]|nr:MAG: hypothetical protein DWI57_09850 [Chloroflexota bacterium]